MRAKHRLRSPWAHCCEARPRALVRRGRRATTRAREQGIGSGFATGACRSKKQAQGAMSGLSEGAIARIYWEGASGGDRKQDSFTLQARLSLALCSAPCPRLL